MASRMGRMSHIHYLCENGLKKELIEELGSTRMAEGFLEAHKEMRDNRHDKPFGKLNEIVDDNIDEYNIAKNMAGNREAIKNMFKQETQKKE